MYVYTCMHVCKLTCVYISMCVCALFSHSLFLNLEITNSARLGDQQSQGFSYLDLPSSGVRGMYPIMAAFVVNLTQLKLSEEEASLS